MKRVIVTAAMAAVMGVVSLAWAAEAAPATARAMIDKVVADVLVVLRNTKLTKEERSAAVEKIAKDHLDFETMAKLSLGRPWLTLGDAQKKSFSDEFKQYVINTYRHTTDEYTDEDIKVIGDRKESNGDATVVTSIVGTQDNGTRGEVAKVEYRMRQSGEEWKIVDVNIAGVSLVANFRSQFQDIIANGSVDKLIKMLHDKNAESAKK